MSYRLISNGCAQRVSDGMIIPPDHRFWAEVQAYLDSGGKWERAPAPTIEQRNNAIRDAAWQWMSTVPKARGYDSIESCCSYAQSSVARYKAEALAMIAWRDAVNQRLEALALAPPAGVTTWEQVKPLLPQPEAFAWPAAVSLPLDQIPPIKLGV
ncbi:hypothetical protein [Xanthomonas citri]|uniref:hypothetical protein n=1 Tax=Xanthomonas citri TaxID=346 RepID=UPI0012FE1543|nr:hypothetical protein [Xanthomonas citri]